MNQPEIKREFPNASSLEAKAELLTELLSNQTQINTHILLLEQAKTDVEKANVLDLLGAEDDIRSANKIIVGSLSEALKVSSIEELNQMASFGYLTTEHQNKLIEIRRLDELSALRASHPEQSTDREK